MAPDQPRVPDRRDPDRPRRGVRRRLSTSATTTATRAGGSFGAVVDRSGARAGRQPPHRVLHVDRDPTGPGDRRGDPHRRPPPRSWPASAAASSRRSGRSSPSPSRSVSPSRSATATSSSPSTSSPSPAWACSPPPASSSPRTPSGPSPTTPPASPRCPASSRASPSGSWSASTPSGTPPRRSRRASRSARRSSPRSPCSPPTSRPSGTELGLDQSDGRRAVPRPADPDQRRRPQDLHRAAHRRLGRLPLLGARDPGGRALGRDVVVQEVRKQFRDGTIMEGIDAARLRHGHRHLHRRVAARARHARRCSPCSPR